jgi:ADP-heptose:LPS heptosyltransferase
MARSRILLPVIALPAWLRSRLDSRGAELEILVVRLGAMGDILRTLPAVRLVRAALPEAGIVWVCDAHWAPLLAGHPDLDGVVPLPRRRFETLLRSPLTWPRLAGEVGSWVRPLRGSRPALALDFHGNLRSGLLSVLSGARVRLGYAGHQQKEGNRWLTTHRVPAGRQRTPRMERNLDLVRALGLPDRPLPDSGLPLTIGRVRAARDLVRQVAGSDRPYAILGPGASLRQAYKKPPATLLAAAARALHEQEIVPLVVYGPGEEADALRVAEASRGRALPAPPTELSLLAALLRRARLFVGGDSGPLHLACGVGCPVVAIYGPTDPVVNAPWGVPSASVAPPDRTYTGVPRVDRRSQGFEGIAPDAVEAAVSEVLLASRRLARHSL